MGDVIDFTSALKKKQESVKKADMISEKISYGGETEKNISFKSEANRFYSIAMVQPAYFVQMNQNKLPFCFPLYFIAMPPPAYFVQMNQNKLPFCFPPHPDDEPPLSGT